MNDKQRFYRQTFEPKKQDKKLRKMHLLDKNTPFDQLYFWSREVRIKDGHKCIQCAKSRRLTSHHLFNKKQYPLLKYNINNGVSLCFNCHMELHRLNDFNDVIVNT